MAGGEWPGLGAERGTVWSGVIRAAIKDEEGSDHTYGAWPRGEGRGPGRGT